MWKTPPDNLSLTANSVHIWRVSLDKPALSLPELRALLSADECARADHFHFDRDRRRYIVGRAFLRLILSRYVQIDPRQIQFAYGQNGKPRLAGEGVETICFNLAHSNELALYAVAYQRQIGIDLEYRHRQVERDQLVAHFFSAAEVKAFRATPADQQQDLFFQLWTQKEAYLKAVGVGLAQPLDSFSVIAANSRTIEFVPSLTTITETGIISWSLKVLRPDNDYIAALAIQGNVADHMAYWRL